ncbi:MAG: hypothetical protein RL681_753 [Candidatus Parcubacteria bacterium]
MGYGHQRTAYPLREIAAGGAVLYANDYRDIPPADRAQWERGRTFYETVSRLERLPFLGKLIFGIFDLFQRVSAFYPKRIETRPTLQLSQTLRMIRKGWGLHFIDILTKNPLPLVTTFFTPAHMAEHFRYPGAIWCIICDADISRTWAPADPATSRVRYCAPNRHVAERLMRYGVPGDHITVTGYPLPKENLGSERYEIARHDLAHRILHLDPELTYRKRYAELITQYVGKLPRISARPVTLLYSVGGAGAQLDILIEAVTALGEFITRGTLDFVVAAGGRAETLRALQTDIPPSLYAKLRMISEPDAMMYFKQFNVALRTADILWTKPSELSFYAGLGIPIIIAPPLGSHEEFNKDWLMKTGAGIPQENPAYADEWLTDWLREGLLAEAAMQGFIEIEKGGVFTIERLVRQNAAV